MNQKVIIFDFDGTIADTVDALVTIANRLAVEFGYTQITPEELAMLRNFTSREIIKYSGVSLFKIPFLLKKVKGELKQKIQDFKPRLLMIDIFTNFASAVPLRTKVADYVNKML